MRLLLILAILWFITGCTSQKGVCHLAAKEDSWVYLPHKPANVKVEDKPTPGYYFEWFSNSQSLYMRCHRPKRSPGCGEVSSLYSSKTGKLIENSEEILVCHR